MESSPNVCLSEESQPFVDWPEATWKDLLKTEQPNAKMLIPDCICLIMMGNGSIIGILNVDRS